jgi:acetyl-CoA synthetase
MAAGSDACVRKYLELYGHKAASLAWLLCDQHPPERVAYTIVDSELSLTQLAYGELRERSERFASALAYLGVKAGDRVATLMGKREEYLVALLGIWRLGAVHVPLFTALAPPAIESRLRRSAAKVVVTETAQRAKLISKKGNRPEVIITASTHLDTNDELFTQDVDFDECLMAQPPGFEAVALGGEAPMVHTFTSGTTGEPKGVVVPTRAVAGFRIYGDYAIGLEETDVYWNAADPGWAYGLLGGVVTSLASGVPSVLTRPGFSPAFTWSVLSALRVTNFTAAPTAYRSLRAWHDPSMGAVNLRCASSAGEPLTPEVNEWAVDALGTEVHDHYGQTETGMLINNHHHPDLKRPLKTGSMGVVMPGWRAEVLLREADSPAPDGTVGRIAVRLADSPLAWFNGYEEEAEKTSEKFTDDGLWYLTGDTGKRDEEGSFFFLCRDDDVIIMAGYRVGPFEIESIIATHPAVRECAVVGAPDAVRGEVIEAYVTLRAAEIESDDLTKELQELVRAQYGAHAYPRAVHVVDELPKTSSGKIQRFALRARSRAEVAARDATFIPPADSAN